MVVAQHTPGKGELLDAMLESGSFAGYTYSYPHKMAYRPFEKPKRLADVWEPENKDALFLYVHIPFCEMRCGFCNLFTVAKPKENVRAPYPEVLRQHAKATKQELGDATFARLAIGGGTPTQLDAPGLEHMVETLVDVMGVDARTIPACSEMSPETIDDEKLKILIDAGIDRASIGIQSFFESETKALRRPQTPEVANGALEMIRRHPFETLNIDLIYGIRGQTAESWRASLDATLRYEPEEIYLYPLYVRPLTGLGNSKREMWDDQREAFYIQGRDYLLNAGYEQVSMRMFTRPNLADADSPVYQCTSDGMVGLGVGARSYTRSIHYCTEYAVGRPSVLGILEDYVARDANTFHYADFGIVLDDAEQKRRFFILSLLSSEGFDESRYVERFGERSNFGEFMTVLDQRGLAAEKEGVFGLTAEGMARSDVIGPWLYTADVQAKIAEYELR